MFYFLIMISYLEENLTSVMIHFNENQALSTKFATFYFDSFDVLRMRSNGIIQELSIEEISNSYHELQLFLGNRKVFLCIDNTHSFSPEKKYRLFYESLFLDYCYAVSMYAVSKKGFMASSVYFALSKVRIPTYLASTKELALQWLREEKRKVGMDIQFKVKRLFNRLEKDGWQKELETDMAYYFLNEDRILNVEAKGKMNDVTNIQENFVRVKDFVGPNKVKVYIDNTKSLPYPKEHRKLYEEQMNELCQAVAVVTKSVPGKIFNNMMIALLKTEYPVKVFNDKKSAMLWLESQNDQTERGRINQKTA